MNKEKYLDELVIELDKYEAAEKFKHASEYDFIIDSLIEEGLTEEEIISKIGNPKDLANDIALEFEYVKSSEGKYSKSIFDKITKEETKKATNSFNSGIALIINIIFYIILFMVVMTTISTAVGSYIFLLILFKANATLVTLGLTTLTILMGLGLAFCIISVINKVRKYLNNNFKGIENSINFKRPVISGIVFLVLSIILMVPAGYSLIREVGNKVYLPFYGYVVNENKVVDGKEYHIINRTYTVGDEIPAGKYKVDEGNYATIQIKRGDSITTLPDTTTNPITPLDDAIIDLQTGDVLIVEGRIELELL